MDANKFLKTLTEKLKEDDWGVIEPEWFDPDFLKDEEPSEEKEWATDLQKIIKDILDD